MKTKIETTAEVKRWNNAVLQADYLLGMAATDVSCPRKLLTLLRLADRPEAGMELEAAGKPLGYFPENIPCQD